MDLLDAIILGIIQGLTEFLPVSSSGHLELGKVLLGDTSVPEESLLFTVVLHFATALSTLVVYRNRNDEVKFMEINPVTARLIHLLEENENQSGQQALQQITQEMNHPNPEVVMQGGLSALQQLQAQGIILGTRR